MIYPVAGCGLCFPGVIKGGWLLVKHRSSAVLVTVGSIPMRGGAGRGKGKRGEKKKRVRKRGYIFQKHMINDAWKRTEEPGSPGKVMHVLNYYDGKHVEQENLGTRRIQVNSVLVPFLLL